MWCLLFYFNVLKLIILSLQNCYYANILTILTFKGYFLTINYAYDKFGVFLFLFFDKVYCRQCVFTYTTQYFFIIGILDLKKSTIQTPGKHPFNYINVRR